MHENAAETLAKTRTALHRFASASKCKQVHMSASSADMICGRPSSCRAFVSGADTKQRPNNGLVCSHYIPVSKHVGLPMMYDGS